MKAEIGTRKSENRTRISDVTPLETPFVLFVDPSSACNFKCTFCPTGDLTLMKEIGRYQGILKLHDFEKIISDLSDFPDPIKVLRLYKDGEPLLNKNLSQMVKLAKNSGRVELVDTTTNGALLNPRVSENIIDSGIDLINISIDGIDDDSFVRFTKVEVDTKTFVDNIKYLYSIRDKCKLVIKTTSEIIGKGNDAKFFDLFGNYCDKIFIENTSPCWPDFDVEERMGIKITSGLYGNQITEQTACPYLFYSLSINSDMKASACFVDWSRGLIVGDVKKHSLKEIWTSNDLNTHRLAHLSGLRKSHSICGNCGQISHCGPDSIEQDLHQIKASFDNKQLFNNLEKSYADLGYGRNKIIKIVENVK